MACNLYGALAIKICKTDVGLMQMLFNGVKSLDLLQQAMQETHRLNELRPHVLQLLDVHSYTLSLLNVMERELRLSQSTASKGTFSITWRSVALVKRKGSSGANSWPKR